jgi:hypothetical protein
MPADLDRKENEAVTGRWIEVEFASDSPTRIVGESPVARIVLPRALVEDAPHCFPIRLVLVVLAVSLVIGWALWPQALAVGAWVAAALVWKEKTCRI